MTCHYATACKPCWALTFEFFQMGISQHAGMHGSCPIHMVHLHSWLPGHASGDGVILQHRQITAGFMLMCVPSALQMCRTHTKNKYYSQKQALEWIMQIAAGLKYLHTLRPKVVPHMMPMNVLQSVHLSHTALINWPTTF